ncbi:MAG: FecR domain-containing protein [Oligoflexia bacterium]|nr:FecR domain-containing protein [Oligoflexia bacterium]
MGQKKTNNIISFLLLLIASLVLAAASYVMFNDRLIYKYFNLDESQGESVASISSTKNDIRRKQANSFVWVKSFDKDELKNQDNVFTGPSSQTVIDFKDGSEITTHSNTLIVVQSAEKGTIVQKGSISVKLKENVKKKFIINNKPVELTAKKNAYVVIKTDGVNAPIIKVISKEPLQEAVITVTSEDKSIKFTENNLSEVVIEDLKPVEKLEEVKVADENHEEITLTKVEQPVAIKEEVKPVELPEIPKVEKEFIEPVREPALSEVKRSKFT